MNALFGRFDGLRAVLGRLGGWGLGLGVLLVLSPAKAADGSKAGERWVIHEWGTFTSLQDEEGKAIGGINTDDEPVPKFVHRVADYLLQTGDSATILGGKGLPTSRSLAAVTMRLETPVLYFHPPISQPTDATNRVLWLNEKLAGVDVTVRFRGGWLSEFYPNAEVDAPGLNTNFLRFGPLSASTIGTLAWRSLAVGGEWTGPATEARVWTAPRAVQAAAVQTASGEAEKFLFYRGVGHIDSPLAVSQNSTAPMNDRRPGAKLMVLRNQWPKELEDRAGLKGRPSWLVDIWADGEAAFRAIQPWSSWSDGTEEIVAETSSALGPYAPGNLEKLKTELHDALVQEGLFDDEATALLNTWEASYFKTPGMRIFFMVPQTWTDLYLPLKASVPAEIKRVMVGRIELVTPQQRNTLKELGRLAEEEAKTAARPPQPGAVATVPSSYQLYLSLGRFRNALVLDEESKRPSAGLEGFITRYGLEAYQAGAVGQNNGAP